MTLAIVDAIRADVTAPEGTVRDDSGAAPIPYLPGHLYAWDRTEARAVAGPETSRGDFAVRLALTVASDDEADGLPRSRAVTQALDAWVDDVDLWVLAHQATSPPDEDDQPTDLWGLLRVTLIDREAIRGPEYRGVLVDLAGWRFIETTEA